MMDMSTASPRFSVVIPAFNAASTLSRAIDSVLEQSYPAHEVIVVDDGSGDETPDVLARYVGRAHYVRQANAGPSAARNRGVAAASGDWIAFLDADDWYYPSRLQSHAEMIAAHPGLDFLVAGFDYRDPQGKQIAASATQTGLGRRLVAEFGPEGRAVMDCSTIGEFIAEQFSDTRGLSVPRAGFTALGGFPVDLKICEDVVFMLRLCAASRRAGVVCASQSVYLVHDNGLIRSDRLRAQTETVRALHTLSTEMMAAPVPIRHAWRRLVKEAHRDWAYHLAKLGRRREALGALVKSLRFSPSWRDGRDLLSILMG